MPCEKRCKKRLLKDIFSRVKAIIGRPLSASANAIVIDGRPVSPHALPRLARSFPATSTRDIQFHIPNSTFHIMRKAQIYFFLAAVRWSASTPSVLEGTNKILNVMSISRRSSMSDWFAT